MYKRNTILILLFLLIGLSACGDNSVTSSYSESVASVQTEIAIESATPNTATSLQENVPEEHQSEIDPIFESLIEKIESGDFSVLAGLEDSDLENLENIKKVYSNPSLNKELEWTECYLNENKVRGLVWREKDSDYEQKKMIVAVFALNIDEVTPVYIRSGGEQMTSFYFLSGNGNIIYRFLLCR